MTDANKEILMSLLGGLVLGLVLLTLMISFFNYKSSANIPKEPKAPQKLANEIDVNAFNKVPYTADQIDKPVNIDKIKIP